MSWIALEDVLGGIWHVLSHSEVAGPVNFTAPDVTNREFTQSLAQQVGKKALLSLPSWFLYLVLGERAEELFLFDVAALPNCLLQTGYHFRYNRLKLYLRSIDAK